MTAAALTHITLPGAVQAEAEALAEQIQELAAKLATSDCLLLMQSSERDDELSALFRQELQAARLQTIRIRLRKLPESVWPFLVSLDLSSGMHAHLSQLAARMAIEDMQPKSLRAGRVQRVCAWIFGSRGEPHRLAAQALRRHPVRRKLCWVRFYDPMTVDCYSAICTSEQRAWWLKDVTAWAYRDRWGRLAVLTPPGGDEPAELPQLDEAAWRQLESIGALNQAWIKARLRGIDIDPSRLQDTLHALGQIRLRGLQSPDDLDLFAWQALQWGVQFHRHALVEDLLRQAGPQAGYCALAQDVDEARWKQVAAVSLPSPV